MEREVMYLETRIKRSLEYKSKIVKQITKLAQLVPELAFSTKVNQVLELKTLTQVEERNG
jgi:hypothetical protein